MDAADLLKDAHLIAAFAQRSGMLKNPELLQAIQKAEMCGGLTWAKPEAVALQLAISAATYDISPVTLLDLKSGFDPFEENPEKRKQVANDRRVLRYSMIGAALCLLFLGAHFSVWQERATSILLEINKNKGVRQQELIRELIPLVVQFESAQTDFVELDDDGSMARDTFRLRISEARTVVESMVSDSNSYRQISSEYVPGSQIWGRLSALVANTPARALAAAAMTPPQVNTTEMPASMRNLQPYSHCFQAKTPNLSDAARESTTLADYKGVYLFGTLVERDDSMAQRIRCLIGLTIIEKRNRFNGYGDTSQMTRRIDVLNIWVLPAIYGMLGAVIFHLRICLDPMRPDPDQVRAVLRIFLGGFAGVAIAWFWRPDTNDSVLFANVSVGALTTAFLFGYSLDVFFTFLDRAVTGLNRASENLTSDRRPT